jgi:uncharacterized protein (DUF305 family)
MKYTGTLIAAVSLILIGLVGMGALSLRGGSLDSVGGGMDAMFIERMIPHHDDAIAMADLALERSERPEIRELAEDIRRTQTAENAQMRAWYREWYSGDVPEVGGGMGMMDQMTDLGALDRASDFDREFLEQMIPHHQMAVMMATMAGSAGGRPELRGLTDSIVRGQSREIELMESWYRDWYGR